MVIVHCDANEVPIRISASYVVRVDVDSVVMMLLLQCDPFRGLVRGYIVQTNHSVAVRRAQVVQRISIASSIGVGYASATHDRRESDARLLRILYREAGESRAVTRIALSVDDANASVIARAAVVDRLHALLGLVRWRMAIARWARARQRCARLAMAVALAVVQTRVSALDSGRLRIARRER